MQRVRFIFIFLLSTCSFCFANNSHIDKTNHNSNNNKIYHVSNVIDNNLLGDLTIPGYTLQQLQQLINPSLTTPSKPYTVIHSYDYNQVVSQSRETIQQIINQLVLHHKLSVNDKVALIGSDFLNLPYSVTGPQGEGNVCSNNYSTGCDHVQQDPIYRTDQFNCTTLVETVLGLLHAKNIEQFDNNIILKIEYGAASINHGNKRISYCNRNNFTSLSLNSINQHNHLLTDVTNNIGLSSNIISTTITPWSWFDKQFDSQSALASHIRVLSDSVGENMVKQFINPYGATRYLTSYCPKLTKSKLETLNYIAKSQLVKKVTDAKGNISYSPNETNLAKIPTPSVIEIVRNDKKWIIAGQPISKLIGSGIIVSHMGLAYRQTFHLGQVIYQQINCNLVDNKKVCQVTPVMCKQSSCTRVMLLDATDAYPNGYYYYQSPTQPGQYVCTSTAPNKSSTKPVMCNRVMAIPLGNYFAQKEYGVYPYMDSQSIIGINIEKIT